MTAEAAAEFESQRSRLFSLAYRMLGSASEAEDVVQETYLRWSAAEPSAVRVPAAWLTKVMTNLCINQLTSARAQRELYVGPRLPEPVFTHAVAGQPDRLGPLESAEQRESVSLALLTLLERLTPAERAVFVLREAFGHSHREIAEAVGVEEAHSRQLHRRARERLGHPRRHFDVDACVAGSVAASLTGRVPKPLRLHYVWQNISLGRRDGLTQFTRADDSPVAAVLTGRASARFKEAVTRSTVLALRR
ncbi:sigma-70 family RNA polymerase sigma factor [Streptomyces sp. NPDC007983]|uniref:sigma-70 family RNA polymerase sigma factor n=1 Tax=Streptomyces sp. NPDC007983 TaxID=3364800 RepID=UPI0036F07574